MQLILNNKNNNLLSLKKPIIVNLIKMCFIMINYWTNKMHGKSYQYYCTKKIKLTM